ncbi:EamA family transporter [Candidatus Kuenenbacteria bacterium]|nr:EamA family transporter [Candidatus Kuenenbacteria bacterium]
MNMWIIFGLLAAVFAALVAIFGKMGLHDIDTTTATTMRAIVMAIFLVVVILIQGKIGHIEEIITNKKALYYIVLSGVAGALSWLFYFVALKLGKVSQVAPLDRLSVVFAIILAALILGEKISLKVGIGAAMMAVGAILIVLA